MSQDMLLNEIANLKSQLKMGEKEIRRLQTNEIDLHSKINHIAALNEMLTGRINQALEDIERVKKSLTIRGH